MAEYSWDDWHRQAVEEGVSAELADLGRQVMRDYYQHGRDQADPRREQLGGNGEYMLQLALQAPHTAFLDFNAVIAWAGAADVDGDVEAFSLLIERLGSQDAADAALESEEPVVAELKRAAHHA